MAEADPVRGEADDTLALDMLPTVTPSAEAVAAHRIVGFNTRDKRARAFALLRTRFAKELETGGYRLLGITSPTPSSGKSFLALNLAASLSRVMEFPVYLVDLDLRRGSVAEGLGIPVEFGIGDFLTGRATRLSDIARRVEGTNLVVLPTQEVDASSAELLAHERFEMLMARLRSCSGNGTVIFDLPPVFADDDAMITAQSLDCYAMVVDSGKTTRRQLQDAMMMLQPTPCLGTVLNRYHGGLLDSYGYGIRSGSYNKYYN